MSVKSMLREELGATSFLNFEDEDKKYIIIYANINDCLFRINFSLDNFWVNLEHLPASEKDIMQENSYKFLSTHSKIAKHEFMIHLY
jgi:hypothetical protein